MADNPSSISASTSSDVAGIGSVGSVGSGGPFHRERRARGRRPMLPASSALVMFITLPGVDDVTVTTIVQPPGGIEQPAGIVISVDTTTTPVHVPVLPEVDR